jgi:prepilin-type N-terminal cleavage/methylation domain-containing protein
MNAAQRQPDPRPARRTSALASRAAFTLVEIIVVIVIVGVLATMVVPRVILFGERQAKVEAEGLRVMLTAIAQRESIGTPGLALVYTPESNELRVEERREAGVEDPSSSGATAPAKDLWQVSMIVAPVTLASARIDRASIDGRSTQPGQPFRLELSRNAPRAPLSLLIVRADGGDDSGAWQLDLVPGQTGASLSALASPREWKPGAGRAVDLDATGRRTGAW